MGDAPIEIENKLMSYYKNYIDVDILKIGHHGSDTSSSYNFLKAVNPKEAIISSGYNNYYNHPSTYVLSYLNNLGIAYWRTDLDGTRVIKIWYFNIENPCFFSWKNFFDMSIKVLQKLCSYGKIVERDGNAQLAQR